MGRTLLLLSSVGGGVVAVPGLCCLALGAGRCLWAVGLVRMGCTLFVGAAGRSWAVGLVWVGCMLFMGGGVRSGGVHVVREWGRSFMGTGLSFVGGVVSCRVSFGHCKQNRVGEMEVDGTY